MLCAASCYNGQQIAVTRKRQNPGDGVTQSFGSDDMVSQTAGLPNVIEG